MIKKKKQREEIYIFAKIKIEKVDNLIPIEYGIKRKTLMFIATITQGNITKSFNAITLSKLFKEIRKEVY